MAIQGENEIKDPVWRIATIQQEEVIGEQFQGNCIKILNIKQG